jgi:hypothetical protein
MSEQDNPHREVESVDEMLAMAAAAVRDLGDEHREMALDTAINEMARVIAKYEIDPATWVAAQIAAVVQMNKMSREFGFKNARASYMTLLGIAAHEVRMLGALPVRNVDPVRRAHVLEQAQLHGQRAAGKW